MDPLLNRTLVDLLREIIGQDELRLELLEKGPLLFLETAVGDQGKMLEAEGFIRLIANTRTNSLTEGLASCIAGLKHWCGRVPLGDDVSLLAIEMHRQG